jgi:hypothetical protein
MQFHVIVKREKGYIVARIIDLEDRRYDDEASFSSDDLMADWLVDKLESKIRLGIDDIE